MAKKKLIIIDGNALIHRAFHALPPLANKDGELVNAVYGFASILLKIYKDLKPDFLVLTLDRAAKTFRHEAYAEYKATRIKQPDELYNQIPYVRKLAEAFNIPTFAKDGFEADDLIGTICKTVDSSIKKIIVTGDMDALQLVNDDTEVFTLKKGITDTVIYDAKAVEERYGLRPDQMIDYKALRGDASDNIPGVKGVGEKTAVELLQEFGTVEKVLAAAKKGDKKIKERYQKLLVEHEEDAKMSKRLATIVTDVPIDFDLDKTAVDGYDQKKVFDLFQHLGFKSLLSRLPASAPSELRRGEPEPEGKKASSAQGNLFGNENKKTGNEDVSLGFKTQTNDKMPLNYNLVSDDKSAKKFVTELKKQKLIVIDTETTSLSTVDAKLCGIGFAFADGTCYYVPFAGLFPDTRYKLPEVLIKEIKEVLADKEVKKVGHHIKYDLEILKQHDFEVNGVYFDTMLASYLLSPGSRAHSLDSLAFSEFGHQKITTESLIGKGKAQITMEDVPVIKVAEYCCEDVDYTFRLYKKLEAELKKKNLFQLLEKIELPLSIVLAEMELLGVKIDKTYLNNLDKKIEKLRVAADDKIYELAGKEFNIDSPLQLKEILFDKLKISIEGLKKLKTGISTAAAELDKLRGRHEIINFISEHRELAKLQSTYTQTLPDLINKKTGRVHTSFNQTIAATGRLSSSDPNLQNIPIRTELGREIRKAFIADKGKVILKADYSQIELRIVASLAKDQKMLEIFQKGEDIHKATAAEINGVSISEVTKDMRYRAKEVNFGVLYGMGAYGLAWRTGISREEAKFFIDKYFSSFSNVKKYIDETIVFAKKEGYVETLFGRVRFLPEINSGVAVIRNAAERMAVNAPIQGTAADLIKLAMIEIDKKIKTEFKNDEVRMILQVHDELVFEIKKDAVEKAAAMIKDIMENVYKLRVPIVADIEVGENWGETEKV